MSSQAPVVVIGAGLAGSLLALALSRRGIGSTLLAPAAPAATGLSYGAMVGRGPARAWRRLERCHGPLGWRRSRLLLHGWPQPLQSLPPAWQALATRGLALSRVDPLALGAALPAALLAAGVQRLETRAVAIRPEAPGWRVTLAGGETLAAAALVLAAGAGCRTLWPELPARLSFSWAGVLEVAAGNLPPQRQQSGWLRHAGRGGVVQPLRWQRPALEGRSGDLQGQDWIVDAGLAPLGEALLLGQISLVEPDPDPGRPPDPALMEARLRQGLAVLDPRLAELPGRYRQVPVPFCRGGLPLAGALPERPGLWVFSGFSGAFSLVPPLAEQLAGALGERLAGWPAAAGRPGLRGGPSQ